MHRRGWWGRRDRSRRRRRRRLRSGVGRRGCRRRKLVRHHRGGQGRGQAVHGERACRGEPGDCDEGRAGKHCEPPLRAVGLRPRRRPSFLHPESPSHAAYGHGSTFRVRFTSAATRAAVATARVPRAEELAAARDDVREAQDEQHRRDPEGDHTHEVRHVRPLEPRGSQPTCGSPQFHLSLPGEIIASCGAFAKCESRGFASRGVPGVDVATFLTYDRGSRFLG